MYSSLKQSLWLGLCGVAKNIPDVGVLVKSPKHNKSEELSPSAPNLSGESPFLFPVRKDPNCYCFNKEKYLFVPYTIFESHYCYSIFGIYYSAGSQVNKRKAYWINELQVEWSDSNFLAAPVPLQWPFQAALQGFRLQKSSVPATNMFDLLQNTSIFKNVMLMWGKAWRLPPPN